MSEARDFLLLDVERWTKDNEPVYFPHLTTASLRTSSRPNVINAALLDARQHESTANYARVGAIVEHRLKMWEATRFLSAPAAPEREPRAAIIRPPHDALSGTPSDTRGLQLYRWIYEARWDAIKTGRYGVQWHLLPNEIKDEWEAIAAALSGAGREDSAAPRPSVATRQEGE